MCLSGYPTTDNIIYRVAEGQVNVMVIADGRRDMRSLLERRLLWR
jgi:hypothetical protein